MRFTIAVSVLAGIAAASPVPQSSKGASGKSIIEQLQATFDRNNPNGVPANGSPDDLNGDGVINAFEEGAQVSKRASGKSIIEQLQATFDRNNPNGVPANGSPDDLNGDGVINKFEEGAQVSKRARQGGIPSGLLAESLGLDQATVEDLQEKFDRNNPNGVPANGSDDDLNGDGVINLFEENAQVSKL